MKPYFTTLQLWEIRLPLMMACLVTLIPEPIWPQMQPFLVLPENSSTWTVELLTQYTGQSAIHHHLQN